MVCGLCVDWLEPGDVASRQMQRCAARRAADNLAGYTGDWFGAVLSADSRRVAFRGDDFGGAIPRF